MTVVISLITLLVSGCTGSSNPQMASGSSFHAPCLILKAKPHLRPSPSSSNALRKQ